MRNYMQRVDPTKNMSRFYALDIERNLFGEWSLVRRWGRIGSRGREVIQSFVRHDEAVRAAENWCEKKIRRGYRPSFR